MMTPLGSRGGSHWREAEEEVVLRMIGGACPVGAGRYGKGCG